MEEMEEKNKDMSEVVSVPKLVVQSNRFVIQVKNVTSFFLTANISTLENIPVFWLCSDDNVVIF